MTETLQAPASTSPHASSNVRHLSRMELPGGGQITIQGNFAYRRPPERAGRHDDPRHLRPAQTEDRQPADDAEFRHPHPQGPRGRRSDVHQFRISARHRARQVRRSGLLHLRREGQGQSEARQVHADPRQGRPSLRPRRDLRLYLDRGRRLRRQHPGHLRYPRSVEPGRGRPLVAEGPERRRGRDATSQGHRPQAPSRHAGRQRDVCRLLDVGRRHRRHFRHRQAAHAQPLRVQPAASGADAHLPQGAVRDRRPQDRGVDRGRAPSSRCRTPASRTRRSAPGT